MGTMLASGLVLAARMLFFELFPAFVAIVSVVAFVLLFVADRRARQDEAPRD